MIRINYGRLPDLLIPTAVFIILAALGQSLLQAGYGAGLYGPSSRAVLGAVLVVALTAAFRLLFGPVFAFRLPDYMNAEAAEGEYYGKLSADSAKNIRKVSTAIGTLSAAVAVNILIYLLMPKSAEAEAAGSGSASVPLYLLILTSGICIPFCEELIFRSHLYTALRRVKTDPVAAAVCGILFGVYHENLIQGAYAAVMGFLLCYCFRELSGFTGAFVMHAVINILLLVLSRKGLFGLLVRPAYLACFTGICGAALFMYLLGKKRDR